MPALGGLLQPGLTQFVWLGSGLKKNPSKTAITYYVRKLNLSKSQIFVSLSQNHIIS